MSTKKSHDLLRKRATASRVLATTSLLATGLSVPLIAQSVPFPTYTVGENKHATNGPRYPANLPVPWVVSSGQVITPAGKPVYLGIRTRAKAVALNPMKNDTAAVLQMGAPQAVTVFNTKTGAVLQTYSAAAGKDSDGSNTGITYTPDGKYLLFSQDGGSGQGSFVGIARVSAEGMLSDYAHVNVPMAVNAAGYLTTVKCFPNSPPGTTGSAAIPCGQTVTLTGDGASSSYPTGLAVSPDNKTAYAVLDNNDTLAKIDPEGSTPVKRAEIRVGNVPHSVVISPDGKTAYVSNEAGRIATEKDFPGLLERNAGGRRVPDRLHKVRHGVGGRFGLVQGDGDDRILVCTRPGWHSGATSCWWRTPIATPVTVINSATNQVIGTIDLGLPIRVPGQKERGVRRGTELDRCRSEDQHGVCCALQRERDCGGKPERRRLATGDDPGGVCAQLGCARRGGRHAAGGKRQGGLGQRAMRLRRRRQARRRTRTETDHGVTSFNTHQDLGNGQHRSDSDPWTRWASTTAQVFQNNHWDLAENIFAASGGRKEARPLAIPESASARLQRSSMCL